MKSFCILGLAAILQGGFLGAQETQPAEGELEKALLSGTMEEGAFLKMVDEARALVGSDPWRQANLLFLQASWYLQKERKDAADALLVEAEKKAQEANRVVTSESLRLLAEIRTRFIATRGVPYILGNGGDIERQAQEALRMDPRNQRAALILAYGKINAPALFGGNPDLGLALMLPIVKDPQSVPVLWAALLGVSQALEQKGDHVTARAYAEKALALFPENPRARKAVEKLR